MKYAASRPNVEGGTGLIAPNNSRPFNNIKNGSAVESAAETAAGYIDGALFQADIQEGETATSGGCH